MLTFSIHNIGYVVIKIPNQENVKVYVNKKTVSFDAPRKYNIELVTKNDIRLHKK